MILRSFCLVLALAAGCRESTATHDKASAPVTTTLNDLDVDEIAKWFGSPHVQTGMPDDDALRVLQDFKKAPTFSPSPSGPSKEDVWFGKTYNVLADGSSADGFLFARFRHESAGVSGFAAGLKPQSGNEDGDARRLFAAVSKGGAIDADSATARYVETAHPEHAWAPLGASDGNSKILTDDPDAPRFFRQSGARLLMVQALPKHATEKKTPLRGTGRFAELWKLP